MNLYVVNWGVSETDWLIITIRANQVRVMIADIWCEEWRMISEIKCGWYKGNVGGTDCLLIMNLVQLSENNNGNTLR